MSTSKAQQQNSGSNSHKSSTWTPLEWRLALSRLSPPELHAFRVGIVDGTVPVDDTTAAALAGSWEVVARDKQLPPAGDWRTWYVRGGRGSGKTRTGAETLGRWIRETLHDDVEGDWAIVAPTFGDGRDTCVEGPSGLRRALGGEGGGIIRPGGWNRSIGALHLVDGATVYVDGASDGAERIQGKNLRGAWCDEIGLWDKWDYSWNESLAFALRIAPARVVATGTPKQGHGLVKQLLEDDRLVQTLMSIWDNVDNLHPAAVEDLVRRWSGTRRGRQELEGEFLNEVPGALWTVAMIEVHRLQVPPELGRTVVAVDPSGSADEDTGTSECGIIGAAVSPLTGHGYVLADRSRHASPDKWARAAVDLYHQLQADSIVAERNFGGEMVRSVISAVDPNVPVKLVTASRGKRLRAEPVAALYEQGRVHHVGLFAELEEQQTTWVPDAGMPSPDRVDAVVWAFTELMIDQRGGVQYSAYGGHSEPVVRVGDLRLVGSRYVDRK